MPEAVSLMDMYYQGDGGIYDDGFTGTIQRKKKTKKKERLLGPTGLGADSAVTPAVTPTPAAAQAITTGLGSEYMTPVRGEPLGMTIPQTTEDVLNLGAPRDSEGVPTSDTGWKGFNKSIHPDRKMRESQMNPPADELSAADTQIPSSLEQIKMFIGDVAERETANPTAKGREAFAKITAQYPEFTGTTWTELQEFLT